MTMAAAAPGRDKPASKTLVVAGFISATLFTTVAGGLVTHWVGIRSVQHQAHLSERSAQIERFRTAAEAFDPLVVAFVSEVRDGRLRQSTKDAIKANLLQQRSALESAESLLADQDRDLAVSYVEALVAADAGSKRATGALDSREFAQAAVQIATLRPRLVSALRNG
ncbi:hypothetical protein E4M02_02670 [Brevundimonas sp. S30B]|uniref:hypothetical protein n=1 Tax=unclassified Brevundimonas TaxID=2622653 RepID=UPI00107288C5|nr:MULTISPECIES: hypothetical protein [unclassified Brevundimonas]QBX37207.1 hypothetical protein E4M01_05145 [Brevundimonas sp. MF30-B]TFW03998.1 hypothetical protein E4M02_02670 [Brevundimonas sp. S30B]